MRRIACVVAVVLQAGCAGAGIGPPGEGTKAGSTVDPRLLVAAETNLKERRFAEAGRRFQELHTLDPEHVQVRLGLAEAKLGAGLLAEAEAIFSGLTSEASGRAAALEGLGIVRFRQGDLAAARASVLEALKEDAARWRGWHVLAQLHDQAGEWAEADAAYARALALAPEAELVHNNRGVSLMARKRHKEAAEEFARALALRPGFGTARTNLQLAYAFLGRSDEVLASAPAEDLPRLLNNLGYVAMQRGDYEQAGVYFVRAMEATPSFYPRAWKNAQQLERVRRAELSH